jgi:hypothetical protein
MATKKLTVAEQARKAGIAPNVVHSRLHSGWSLDKALSTPVRLRKGKKRKPDDSSPALDVHQQFRAVVEELEATTNKLETATQFNNVLMQRVEAAKNKSCKPCFLVSVGLTATATLLAWYFANNI